MRIYHNPLVVWIWGGVLIMGCAGPALAERSPPPRRGAGAGPAARAGRGRGAGLRAPAMTLRRLLYLLPVLVFVGVGIGLAVGLTRDPSVLPSALLDQPVPAFDLPPLDGRTSRGLSSRTCRRARPCWSTCSRPGACRAAPSIRC